jgi:zinc D-Ala-D-Ala carboxypeptidase
MSKISEHLELAEVIRSEQAKRLGLSNMPTPEHIENFKKLAENIFEPIRNNFRVPIHISSGYRSVELNKAIKGSSSSQHCKAEAIDVDMDGSSNGVTNKMVFDYIYKNLNFDQLIWEYGNDSNPDWVHVSYSSSKPQRKQALKCTRVNGQPHYEPYHNKASL